MNWRGLTYAVAYSAIALATSSVESLPPSPRRVRVAAATGHVVGAYLAFRDEASNWVFKTFRFFVFLEPIEHQF